VVYNHFGPSGNYLAAYAPSYFSEKLANAWGQAPNFEEPALRDLILENARYWLREFGFDGLRLDATHAIFDASPRHVLSELTQLAHELSPPQLVIAEDERNQAELVTVTGVDALWADDFHHQVHVLLTGERDGYYGDYEPTAQGIADVINRGWLYAGQRSKVSGHARGTSADTLPASAFVYAIQNHDQVGNRAFGERLSTLVTPDAYRAASLLLLFLPMTPLLFMGQEWGAGTPFLYFTDHEPELGLAVSQGRRREFERFARFAEPAARERIPDPQAAETFLASKLRWAELELSEHARTLALYRAALALRRTDPVLSSSGRAELLAQAVDGVLMVHRWRGNERRVLVANFGSEKVSLESLAGRLQLRQPRCLLASGAGADAGILPQSALVLAGVGNLAGLVEGAE
jgi:maltooligosyltrehalose trehalohydrolase